MLRLPCKLRTSCALGLALCASAAAFACSPQPVSAVERTLGALLGSRFDRTHVEDWKSIEGLVVAGGSIRRIAEAVRLARLHPHLRIVLTGAGEQEVEAARDAERRFDARVEIEPEAASTHENAVFSRRVAGPVAGERWLLVTTSQHMPRALGSFHAVSFAVEPWPVDEISGPHELRRVVWHELGGLAAYWLAGKTPTLFPGPDLLQPPAVRVAASE